MPTKKKTLRTYKWHCLFLHSAEAPKTFYLLNYRRDICGGVMPLF